MLMRTQFRIPALNVLYYTQEGAQTHAGELPGCSTLLWKPGVFLTSLKVVVWEYRPLAVVQDTCLKCVILHSGGSTDTSWRVTWLLYYTLETWRLPGLTKGCRLGVPTSGLLPADHANDQVLRPCNNESCDGRHKLWLPEAMK